MLIKKEEKGKKITTKQREREKSDKEREIKSERKKLHVEFTL